MNRDKKILVIGFGSIGQRHYNNLKKLGFNNVSVYDIDKTRISEDIFKIDELTAEELGNFDVVFICNPTAIHVNTATLCAEAGCNIFMEKPLSHSMEGVEKLVEICSKQEIISMVGCNLRFEPAIAKTKELVDSGKLGRLYAIYLEYARYLPYQRPNMDYREVYASSKAMGGGIMLDDIHDFDLLFWFNDFNPVEKAFIQKDTLSDLEIDVEDICNATFKFENKVYGNIRCDYLQRYKHRNMKLVGELGNLVWEFRENKLWYEYYEEGEEKRSEIDLEGGAEVDNYVEQIKYFMNKIEKREKTFNEIRDSAYLLKTILNEV